MDEKQKPGVVEEVVDNSGGTDETDALMADLISEVEQEFQNEDLAALPDATEGGTESLEADGDAAGDGTSEKEPAEPAEEDAGDEDDRSVARLVAREVELRTKEDALKAREAAATHVEQENATLKAQIADLQSRIPEDFIDQLRVNPWDTLEKAGYDPDHVIKVALAQKLQKQGKEVPKELREAIREAEYEYKFKTQEKKLAQIEQQRRATEFVAKVETEARQYINGMTALKPEFSKDAPTVAKVAKANPERVFAEIMDEIGRDATARGREPNAALISYAEAARRVEKRWADMRKLFTDGTPAQEASTTAAETPARAATGVAPNTKKSVKPLTAPKAKTQEELEKEGLELALAEYKRVELASKKPNSAARR